MPSREFKDSKGQPWLVWATVPQIRTGLDPSYADGWLSFESPDGSLRRLAPVPAKWEEASDERLELMCRAAMPVERVTGPFALPTRRSSLADDVADVSPPPEQSGSKEPPAAETGDDGPRPG